MLQHIALLSWLGVALAAPRWREVSANGSWPDPRFSHSAVVTPDGEMLLFGGNTLDAVNHLFSFSFARSEWTRLKPQGEAPAKRYGHSAVALDDGRMLVFGGFNGSFLGDLLEYTPSRCDGDVCSPPVWQKLSCTGTPPCARDGHAAMLLPDGRTMLVIGGFDGKHCFNDVHALDTTTMTWRQLAATGHGKDPAAMPAPRYLHSVAPCKAPHEAASAFLMFGGYVDDGAAPFSGEVWRFDMAVAAQAAQEGGPGAEGGEGAQGGEGGGGGVARGVWRRLDATGDGPAPAFGQSAVADAAGHVFVFGGFGGQFSNAMHVFTHNASDEEDCGAWARVGLKGELPSPRHKHSMVLSPQGRLVVFGGNDFGITKGLYEVNAAATAAAMAEGGDGSAYAAVPTALRLVGTLLLLYGQLRKSDLVVKIGFALVLASYGYSRLESLALTLRGTEPSLKLRGGGAGALLTEPSLGLRGGAAAHPTAHGRARLSLLAGPPGPGLGRTALRHGVGRVVKARRGASL